MSAPAPPPFVELTARLARYPADRYPVQHATTSFHLGTALTGAGRHEEAVRALTTAVALFDPDRMPAEHAKALNARGAALRGAGRPADAVACFQEAAAGFEKLGMDLEQGAALFNLGLARRETGADPTAEFRQARALLDADRVPAHAAAAARELGAELLTAGAAEEAVGVLAEAAALADRARDTVGLGAAANTLGLAHLARAETGAAIDAFTTTVGAHPRNLRPDQYAMAKANLALAYQRADDVGRARLAAHQALGVPNVPEAVRRTAADVLARVGGDTGGLLDVLDLEPDSRWPALVHEELVRWADAWPEDRALEADALVRGVLARPVAPELVAVWLGGLLEMPPAAAESLVRAVVQALPGLGAEERRRFRDLVARGCARFHLPQMERLTRMFEDLSARYGGPSSWR